jgi:multiple sugar transport system permease protein
VMRQACLLAAAVALVVVVLFPIYWMFVTSILPTRLVLSREPPLLPPLSEMTLNAYIEVFRRRPIFAWLLNSVLVTAGSTLISLVIAAMAGYSLSRFRTPAQQAAGFTLLVSKMLPGSLIVIPFFIMFSTLHLIDNLLGLVLANVAVGVPFATWMMKGFFDTIPREIEYAAMVDGCSEIQALRLVVPWSYCRCRNRA